MVTMSEKLLDLLRVMKQDDSIRSISVFRRTDCKDKPQFAADIQMLGERGFYHYFKIGLTPESTLSEALNDYLDRSVKHRHA